MSGGRRVLAALALALLASSSAALPTQPDGWWQVHSASFTLYTDAEAERAAEIVTALERLRDAFARLSPEVSLRAPVPTRIIAFRDAESFAPYKTVADRGRVRILGQFLGHRDGNFITVDADPQAVGALATIQHEYVHELVQHNFPRVPLWFNEGLAEYYSTFAVEGGSAFIGRPVARHLRWLRSHPDLELGEVLAATRESAAGHGAEATGRLYAVSWLLVHYLLSGDGERLDGAAELLYRLERGDEPEAALEAALGERLVGVAERLREYLTRPLAQAGWRLPAPEVATRMEPAAAADLLTHLGDLQLIQQRLAEAGRHYDLALAYDGYHAEAHSGLAALRDHEARRDEARVLHREALALAPAGALPYLRYGRHLMTALEAGVPAAAAGELAAAARDAFATAARLEPGFAECRAMLGAAQLLPGGERERGVALLTEVRAELPRRADVVFNLLQLELALGRIGPATALLRGSLTRLADPLLLARAAEAVERTALLEASRAAVADGEVEEGLELLDRALAVTSDDALRAAIAAQRATIERRGGRRSSP